MSPKMNLKKETFKLRLKKDNIGADLWDSGNFSHSVNMNALALLHRPFREYTPIALDYVTSTC